MSETRVRPGLDRAGPLRKDLSFLEACLSQARTRIVPVWGEQVLCDDAGLYVPCVEEARELLEGDGELVWLGHFEDQPCFALDLSAVGRLDELRCVQARAVTPVDLRLMAPRLSASEVELAFYARAMLLWHARTQHCSTCGAPCRPREGGHLRVCSSARCGASHFPRTDPVVLALIVRGDACLLGRQKGWPEGMYSALAGFVEPGETLEQAVHREVLEEVSVPLDTLRYAGSQPWPFPASLMIGFVATTSQKDLRIDAEELEDARWFTRAEIRAMKAPTCFVPPPFSLAGRLIHEFAEDRLVLP